MYIAYYCRYHCHLGLKGHELQSQALGSSTKTVVGAPSATTATAPPVPAAALAGLVPTGASTGHVAKEFVDFYWTFTPSIGDNYRGQFTDDSTFVISIVDLENPEIRDATSTYLHFAIVPFNA